MSWQDRVQSTIELASPNGEVFSVKWAGDQRSVQKKLGVFTYPKFDGAVIQDLGLAGTQYPLELFFDGPDNDLQASRFFEAFNARGSWFVKHPTKGLLKLQPVSVTEHVEPIESGSITVMVTRWLQPADVGVIVSIVQLAARIRSLVLSLQAITAVIFKDTSKQETVEQTNVIKSSTTTSLGAYDKTVAPLLTTSSDLEAEAAAVRRGITDTLSETPVDTTILGGQIQAVVAIPARADIEATQLLNTFSDFIVVMATLPDEVADQNYINLLAVRELFLVTAIAAMAQAVTAGTYTTRAQALEAAQILSDQFQALTAALDEAQAQFSTKLISQQYFSQSTSFVESAQIVANAIRHLLEASFDLAIEKRFTLDRDRVPIEITITEYGDLGDEDSNFDLFIASNNLKGNDILILPAGREVVVYV